jgi:TetR/AcrR family transcriptional regulator, lmrAB and yxaGH operons repressor
MARESSTAARMVDAGELLLSERGYGNVTMIEVIDKAEAPRGSIYYHFPGGKEDLARQVVAKVGDEAVSLVDWAAERTDGPEDFLRLLVDRHRRRVEKSDFALGCPMMGIMVNAATESEGLRSAVSDAFTGWMTAVAQGLTSKGLAPAAARRVASTFVATVEGAILVSRSTRSLAPFTLLADTVPGLLATQR